jgi:arylsulfatase A-like enzyme
MYEQTVGIPLIIKPPKGTGRPGSRDSRLVNTTDLYATILDVAGSPHAESRHGRSLVPLVEGRQEVPWRDAVVSEFTGLAYMTCSMRMLRCGNLKYVFNCGGPDELYDLEEDPGELENRIDHPHYSERLAEIRLKLAEELERLDDPMAGQYRLMRCRDALKSGLNG